MRPSRRRFLGGFAAVAAAPAGASAARAHPDPRRAAAIVRAEFLHAVIRMLGGLLAGYHATGEARLLALARDLGDRLLPCFTKSPIGAPYRYVNLRTGAVREAKMNLAEIGTKILEFGELSRLTGDRRYAR